ncbi:hypothetical protein [Microbacterium kunmingense]|uniref:hypothetical protein n=1 Tax=Microbacterium kunmingense TaxID=2915939 RepID=UPI002004E3B1|nr:hypothetical protein [Microbacterium kunmingense]
MNLLRWLSLVLFLAVMAAFFYGHRSWELLAAALVLAGVLFWTCGAGVIFTRSFWLSDDPEVDAHCSRIDAELSAIEREYRHSRP